MKISIVVPTWNSEEYLPDLLESIRRQNYKNIEIIVVDNISSDRTLDVVDRFSDGLPIKVICERDKGQGDAVSKGMRVATGEIVHWHAADDIMLEGALSTVSDLFKNDEKLDLVYSDGLAFAESSRRLHSSWTTLCISKFLLIWGFARFQSDTAYWRRSIGDAGLPFNDDVPLMVDEEFFLRLTNASRRIMRVRKPLGLFRIRAGQISGRSTDVNVADARIAMRRRLYQDIGIPACPSKVNLFLSRACYFLANKAFSLTRYVARCCGYDIYKEEYKYLMSIGSIGEKLVNRRS